MTRTPRYQPLGTAFIGRRLALVLDTETDRIYRIRRRFGHWVNFDRLDALVTDKSLIRAARKALA